jgi:hypothetical protein
LSHREIDKSLNNLNDKLSKLWPEESGNGHGNNKEDDDDKIIDPDEIAKWWYQETKEQWMFHKSSYYMRGLNAYDGQGCNSVDCIPECLFYPAEGKLYPQCPFHPDKGHLDPDF